MKYQHIFTTCIGVLFFGCKAENAIYEESQEWITTEENPQVEWSEQEHKIQGNWRLIKSNCPTEEQGLMENWSFNKGELIWNSYTHNYHFQHDTLFIAGQPHAVSWKGEELLLKVLEMNCTKRLKRQEVN